MKSALSLPLLMSCCCVAVLAGPLPNTQSPPTKSPPQTVPVSPPRPLLLGFTWVTSVACSNEYTGLQFCTNAVTPQWIVLCQFALPPTPGAIVTSSYVVTNPPQPYCLWRAYNTVVPLVATNH